MLDERFATINTYECFAPTHFLITENYIRINLGVTFMERWFMKLMVD